MSDKKYPLFSPTLMQVNSFSFVAPTYQHPFKDEWTVGAIGHALNEQDLDKLDATYQNDFLSMYDELMEECELVNNA